VVQLNDLHLKNVFIWSCIKVIKLSNRVYYIPSLHPRLVAVIIAVPVIMSFQVWDEVGFCVSVCRPVIGAHIKLH
jgi:hypothetical protein